MSLSKDMLSVQRDWVTLGDDVVGFGCSVFEELFATNPEYVKLFSGVAQCGELTPSNPKMREHAMRVFSALGSWITALPDDQCLAGLLELQGKEHKDRKVGERHFNDLRPALLTGVRNRLGHDFNQEAWNNVFNWFLKGLGKGWN